MSEKLHNNYGDTEEDFRGVNYWTLAELVENEDYKNRLSPEDIEHIEKEKVRREQEGEIEDDEGEGMAKDLISHGFGIKKGQILYPNDEIREMIARGDTGQMPHRETLRERADKAMQSAVKKEQEVKKVEVVDAKAVAELAIKTTRRTDTAKHLKLRGDISDGAKKWMLGKEEELRKIYEAQEKGWGIFRKASEPLTVQMLGSSVAGDAFLPGIYTRANWATRYDDYCGSTDIIYEVESPVGDKVGNRKIITMSVDVTTAISDKVNKGVREKFDEFGYHREREIPWAQKIVCCGIRNDARTTEHAPHFIIGLSEDTFERAAKSMATTSDNIITSGQLDKDIAFMVASEFWEQAKMQEAFLKENSIDNQKEKVRDIEQKMKAKMVGLLRLGASYTEEDFLERYENKVAEMARRDKVYNITIDETRKIKRGQERMVA